jgi:hypothetical protein
MENQDIKFHARLNYYVLALIFILIAAFETANYADKPVEPSLDFFEAARIAGFMAASIFAFWVAKMYWRSAVFGKAYLSLAIGYALYTAGDSTWYVYEVILQTAPYPSLADIGYFGFYPFAIYHLWTNIHYFKRKLEKRQKNLLLAIPLGSCMIYSIFALLPLDLSAGVDQMHLNPDIEHKAIGDMEFLLGLAYVAATTLVFSFAIIGTQIFHYGKLGTAWGLLLVGIALNTWADYYYYFWENFGDFDRSNPVHGIWLAGAMVVCYALYKHIKSV